jgi:2-amino-4-hydroxy-6-hydroxymethyldihydropteridine diphosphokinase
MSKHIVYLALGSNLGDRLGNLRSAREALSPQVEILACSSVYETPPWGFTNQPAFYNQVLRGATTLSPHELLAYVKKVELVLGRAPTFKNGPRLIDIDILYYDDLVLDTPELGLPHPRMEGRAFVWLPLAELAPKMVDPLTGKNAREVAQSLDCGQISRVAVREC